MRLTCTQENLLGGLMQVVPIAGRNSQLPILQHVLLQVKESVLHFTTTDLEIGVHTIIGGKIEEEGSCTISARHVLEYVQQLPGTHPIYIQKKGNTLSITTKGYKAQFPISDPEDFPLLPSNNKGHQQPVDGQQLCQGLGRVLFAAAREDTRPEIHSVFIKVESGQLKIATTDSFRLAEEVITISKSKEDKGFLLLLPLSAAQEIVRLFSHTEIIQVASYKNHVGFEGGSTHLSSRLIDGTYPDYQQIIPTSWRTEAVVDTDELVRAFKTLLVFLPRDSRRVQLQVQPSLHKITLMVGGESGEGSVVVPFEGEGEELKILFNIQYLLEGVQRIPGKQCRIYFGGETDPTILRPLGDDIHYLYVVMPIQV